MMAGAPQVALVGSRAFRKQLKAAGVDLTDLRETYRGASEIVVGYAKPRTPVRTGALKASVRAGAGVSQATVRAGGAKVPYAAPIHWGWPARNIEAQPWLVDAAHSSEPQWLQLFQEELDRAIETMAGDYRKLGG